MLQYWLVFTLSWVDLASLQYINTGGPEANAFPDPLDPALQYPLPYSNYFNLAPSDNGFEKYQSQTTSVDNNQFYHREDGEQAQNIQIKRSAPVLDQKDIERWYPSLIDTDKTIYLRTDIPPPPGAPFIIQRFEGQSNAMDTNDTATHDLEPIDKKSFSPWGGKRSRPKYEQSNMWTWKRTANMREPSMPKRVRFSPWGGKRSGQLIYKPGAKGSKIIFSNSVPELTRIVSNYSPNGARFNLAGFQLIPSLDKRHPIHILAISTKLEEQMPRDNFPIRAYVESSNMFKPGHPYADVNLKKDGKRKVKFSAWGGKRSPPIIGPIWTPPSQNGKDNTLNAILLIRNSQSENSLTTKAL